tara:strand:+ start:827 stop:1057 length:231 start_codon:yes stop_codon:yes gene_type:complete
MVLLEELTREVRRNLGNVRSYCEGCKSIDIKDKPNYPYAGDFLPYAIAPVLLTLGLVEPFVEAPVREIYRAVRKRG